MARSVGVTRERVVAVAAELADEVGLQELTLAQVATQLGVKIPSLYNHVDGLPGLQRELAMLGIRELGERLRDAAVGKAHDDAVLAMGQAYRAYVLEHPGRYAASVRAPHPEDRELQQLSSWVVGVVVTVLRPYELGEEGTIHAVRGLRSVAHGFATLERAGGFGMPLERDTSFLLLMRTFIAGLHAWREPEEC